MTDFLLTDVTPEERVALIAWVKENYPNTEIILLEEPKEDNEHPGT